MQLAESNLDSHSKTFVEPFQAIQFSQRKSENLIPAEIIRRRDMLIEEMCGPISIKSTRLKSEQSRLQLKLVTEIGLNHLMLPENRALLLDYLS